MARMNECDMTPIHTVKNQYRGVNAHLHSTFQSQGLWGSFHTNHIGDLMRVMQVDLIPMGYKAEVEQSLQVRRLDLMDVPDGQPESDVTIYDRYPGREKGGRTVLSSPDGTLILPTPEAIAEPQLSEKQYSAVAIYELVPKYKALGSPVAWVELLSPSNKGRSEDAEAYRAKRNKLLRGGIVFVEIDYLHESPPSLGGVSNYATWQREAQPPDAHPYRIAVLDPRPNFDDSTSYIKEFDVDESIPTMTIPLNAGDTLAFNFGRPYQKTFEETLYGLTYVDYAQFPVRFERYSAADRARIARRMLAIMRVQRNGEALENAPLPVDDIPLESALNVLKAEFDLLPENV